MGQACCSEPIKTPRLPRRRSGPSVLGDEGSIPDVALSSVTSARSRRKRSVGSKVPHIRLITPCGSKHKVDENGNVIDGPDPGQALNLCGVLGLHSWDSRKPALINADSGDVLSYGALQRRVRRLASGLQTHGVTEGDVICVVSRNCPDVVVVFLAASSIGAITVIFDPSKGQEHIILWLMSVSPRLVLAGAPIEDALQVACDSCQIEMFLMASSREKPCLSDLLGVDLSKHTETDDVNRLNEVVLQIHHGDASDINVDIPVRLTHSNVISNIKQLSSNHDIGISDGCVLCTLPSQVPMGLVGVVCLGLMRRTTVMITAGWDLRKVVFMCKQYKVSSLALSSSHCAALVTHPLAKEKGLLPPEVVSFSCSRFPQVPHGDRLQRAGVNRLVSVFGLAEATCCISVYCSAPGGKSMSSIMPNTRIKLIDRLTGRQLRGPGREGEICVQGPQVIVPLYNPEAFQAGVLDHGSWLHTGMLGIFNRVGVLQVKGRVGDVICTHSDNHTVIEKLTSRILTHPAVDEATVVATPALVALVVLKQYNPDVTSERIKECVNSNLVKDKQLDSVQIVNRLPRTTSGKVKRRSLAKHFYQPMMAHRSSPREN